MAHMRANKSGFAAEAQRKIESNYDQDEARKCLAWVKAVTDVDEIPNDPGSIDCSSDGFHLLMKDGIVLCKLIDTLMPGQIKWSDKTFQIPKIEGMRLMRERERIAMFSKLVQTYGVPETYTFPTESVHEKGALNLAQVCVCLRALGIEAQARGVGPDNYWPRKAERNTRDFSDEQMRAGANVISLQYGTNKGASQAGMNMGKQRKILD